MTLEETGEGFKRSRVKTDLDADFSAGSETRYLDQITVDNLTTRVIEYLDATFTTVERRSEIMTLEETGEGFKRSRVKTDLDADFSAGSETRYLDQITVDNLTTRVIEYLDASFPTVESRSEIMTLEETGEGFKRSRVKTDLDANFSAGSETRYLDQITVDNLTTRVIEYLDSTFVTVESRSEIMVLEETGEGFKRSRVKTDLDANFSAGSETRYLDQITVDNLTTRVIEYLDSTFVTVESRSEIMVLEETGEGFKRSRVKTDLDANFSAGSETRYLDQITVDNLTTRVIEYLDATFTTVESRSEIMTLEETAEGFKRSRVKTDLDADFSAGSETRYLDQITVDNLTTRVIEYLDATFTTVESRSEIMTLEETGEGFKRSRVKTDLDADFSAGSETRYLDQITVDNLTTRVIQYLDATFVTVESRSEIMTLEETAEGFKRSRVKTDLDANFSADSDNGYLDQNTDENIT